MRALLIDVGGTLWPNDWPSSGCDTRERVVRLRGLVPQLDERDATRLVGELSVPSHPATQRQQTDALIAQAVATLDTPTEVSSAAVRTAMCLPAHGRVEPFSGAVDLLAGLAAHGVRVVVVSNVMWRDIDAHRQDFDELGLSDYVHDYVTSIDVGWRKPHPRFFDRALRVAACPPSECVMVGDSETNDIAPAHLLGMTTIRVAIEEPTPDLTVADHICLSLPEVAGLLGAG